MVKTITCFFFCSLVVILPCIACQTAIGKQLGDDLAIKFTGRFQQMTSCLISNEQVINVSFAHVGINKVDSGQYVQDLNYDLDCGSATSANTILMTFKATPVTGSLSAFSSGAPGLWVQILKDGLPLALNQEFRINDPNKPPSLQVQLIKDPATDLQETSFSVTGTLVTEYM